MVKAKQTYIKRLRLHSLFTFHVLPLIALIGDNRPKDRHLMSCRLHGSHMRILLELLLAVIAVSKRMQRKILTLRLERQQV